MIQTFEDLCTYVYVTVDALFQAYVQPHDRRPGPHSQFSDSELITLTLVAELVSLDDETVFLDYVARNHRALFPLLPERSRYNRRRRILGEAINTIRRHLLGWLLALLPPTTARCVCSTVCQSRSSAFTMRRGGIAGTAGRATATMPPKSRRSMALSSIC